VRRLALAVALALAAASALAAEPRRSTVWDLKLGAPVVDQPAPDGFKSFACGSDGGPPMQRLAGWADYARCRADRAGLHEIAFEYDDEAEFVARARGQLDLLPRLAGTSELAFPVIVSGRFDDAGILKAIRLVSDPRPDYRPDQGDAELRSRRDAYKLSGFLAARFDIDPARDCVAVPPTAGEAPVGQIFVKQDCVKSDGARRLRLATRYLRKPGQSDRDPMLESRLTRGQFESATRFEIEVP
jgi:hypothetical protein